jgi:hypothetical protein
MDGPHPLISPKGKEVGQVFLRRSTACGAAWAIIRGPIKTNGLPFHIDLYRPADRESASFTTSDVGDPIWGDMLSIRQACVYAEVYVGAKKNAKITKTACKP